VKQPVAGGVNLGSSSPVITAIKNPIPVVTANKAPVPVKELDLQQRWRERQAAASEIKRELPPLPSFQTTSLPPLPALPSLPPLTSAKPKTPVASDKPAAPKVAPPSPVYPCVRAACSLSPCSVSHVGSQVCLRPAFSGVERVRRRGR
jgi:hypothetical protein